MLGPELTPVSETEVLFGGRRLLFFAGNDYHRLSRHPDVVRALIETAQAQGISAAGSRATTANHPLHVELESALAEFLAVEAVALCASGYLSNAAALQGLAPGLERIFLEASAHSSLAEAAVVTGVPIVRFPSRNAEALASALQGNPGRCLILCDGVAPSTGHLAPLREYANLASECNAKLVIDDAHGIGVLGPRGRGIADELTVEKPDTVRTGTLSKAFGCFGGFVAGRRSVIDAVRERSTAFIGATPIPVPLAAAGIAAIRALAREPERLSVLRLRASSLKQLVRDLGFDPSAGPAPIVSMPLRSVAEVERLRAHLLERGIFPPFIRYPGAPAGGHFRFTLSSRHSDAEVEMLHSALRDWAK